MAVAHHPEETMDQVTKVDLVVTKVALMLLIQKMMKSR